MEIHQVRYFLAVSRSLNFTRAAEECHVAQPSLSRAIKQLEGELGGELFRRERAMTHLTDLGRLVLPALQQCYDSTMAVRELAQSFNKEGHAPLNLGLARTIELEQLSSHLNEITTSFPQIEIKIIRGSPRELAEIIKRGDIEIAVAGQLGDDWGRLESWVIFRQCYGLLMHRSHPLSNLGHVDMSALSNLRLLCRPDCVMTDFLWDCLATAGIHPGSKHQVPSVDDMVELVLGNFGVGIAPLDKHLPDDLFVREIDGVELSRDVYVMAVAGRKRSVGAQTMIKLLRAADWERPANLVKH